MTTVRSRPWLKHASSSVKKLAAKLPDKRLVLNRAGDAATIDIYGSIGESLGGISAGEFAATLKNAKGARSLRVNISSDGGVAFDGLTIFGLLRDFPGDVTTYNAGLAASAASLILMGGDTILSAPAAVVMIHEANTAIAGTAGELERIAAALRVTNASIVGVYEQRTGMPRAKIEKMMAAESWLSAAEAKSLGFIDEITEGEHTARGVNRIAAYARPAADFAADVADIRRTRDTLAEQDRQLAATLETRNRLARWYS